jgi:putative oxidoreductase
MKILTWALQILLAIAFCMAGFMKSTQPIDQLATQLPWVAEYPAALVRFIGISELAGGLGLILPWVTGIRRQLTPLAGWGLALVMVLAVLYHITRGEFGSMAPSVVLGGLSAFVAWRRGQDLKAA